MFWFQDGQHYDENATRQNSSTNLILYVFGFLNMQIETGFSGESTGVIVVSDM